MRLKSPSLHFKTDTSFSKSACCEMVFDGASLDFIISLCIQSGNETKCSIKGGKMNMWLVLFWTGPIGIGIFLVCLGGMIYLISKADEVGKRTKAFIKEKGLEKK
jgi:hypothetical protein